MLEAKHFTVIFNVSYQGAKISLIYKYIINYTDINSGLKNKSEL